MSGYGQQTEALQWELLVIVETNADERIAAWLVFDPDDLEAAFEELNRRYLAGEAAAYAHTWSVAARVPSPLSIGTELPPTEQPDFVLTSITEQKLRDHRGGCS